MVLTGEEIVTALWDLWVWLTQVGESQGQLQRKEWLMHCWSGVWKSFNP
jgi:hypothetical protein